jgi:DNA-binding NarL/FixJ family response regulator
MHKKRSFLIADDHMLVADAMALLLQRGFPSCTVQRVDECVKMMDMLDKGLRPDLILLDYKMPGMSGFKGLHDLRQKYPSLAVAFMSGIADDEAIQKALSLGVRAYLPKTMRGKSMLAAIHMVLNGEHFVPLHKEGEDMAYMPSSYKTKGRQHDSLESLSSRQKDILKALSCGLSNQEIADQMDLHLQTIKQHVSQICKKIGVRNRTEAAIFAKDHDI